MDNTAGIIHAECPSYACRICRTKTGWPHQVWCGMKQVEGPNCKDCHYFDPDRARCIHPLREKGGVFADGTA